MKGRIKHFVREQIKRFEKNSPNGEIPPRPEHERPASPDEAGEIWRLENVQRVIIFRRLRDPRRRKGEREGESEDERKEREIGRDEGERRSRIGR